MPFFRKACITNNLYSIVSRCYNDLFIRCVKGNFNKGQIVSVTGAKVTIFIYNKIDEFVTIKSLYQNIEINNK